MGDSAANPLRRLDKEAIKALPIKKYGGPVELIRSDTELQRAWHDWQRETALGFDIEIRPAFSKGESYPPALVQLAGSRAVYLVQLKFLKTFTPLAELFSSPDILKVGVGIADDLRKLSELLTFAPAGFVELGKIAARAGIDANGVRTLAGNLLGIRVTKGAARLSNWERETLTPGQIAYASTDAWICRQVYLALKELI